MRKTLLGGLVGIFIVLPLAAFLIPALYAAALIFAVVLPLVCVVTIVQDAKTHGELGNFRKTLGKLFLAIIVLPVMLVAFAAPLRSILLAALSFFPEAMGEFNNMHAILYERFIPIFGPLFPYWLDVYWGVLSLLAIFLIALCSTIRRNRLIRQVEILPTAKIRSVAVGLVELQGKAVPLKKGSRTSPIMRSWLESTDNGLTTMTHTEPFYLDDGSGRILVDPNNVSINDDGGFFDIALHQAILKEFKKAAGFSESRLMPGDEVYLVGNVQINRDRLAYEDAEVVVKPSKISWLSMNFYDLFFISNIGETALLDRLRNSFKRGWRNVLIAMAVGAWLSAFALSNIIQLEAYNIDAAPAYLRLISTPTTLERELSIGKYGKRPTIEFVEMLKEGDRKTTKAIMRQLRKSHVESLALPILKTQAMDLDHRGFGTANYWLSELGKTPRGWWGYELFSDHYMNDSEVLVLRLATRYSDNRLFVSYRAYVGKNSKRPDDHIRSRNVVIDLVSKESGKKFTASFAAGFGLNGADDVEAFEFLYPGEYELDVYLETFYRSGYYNLGSRRRSPVRLRLKE